MGIGESVGEAVGENTGQSGSIIQDPGDTAQMLFELDYENGWGDHKKLYECRGSQYNLVADPEDAGNTVARFYQPGNEQCDEGGGNFRNRTTIQHAPTTVHNANGVGLRFGPHIDYWFGFRFYVTSDSVGPYTSSRYFMLSFATCSPGEPAILVKSNDRIQFNATRYKNSQGQLVEDNSVTHTISNDAWNNFVLRWRRGFEFDNDGTYKVWINGNVICDFTNIITGTDWENVWGCSDPHCRTGIYFSTIRTGATYTLYMDDLKIAEGTNGYDVVSPS